MGFKSLRGELNSIISLYLRWNHILCKKRRLSLTRSFYPPSFLFILLWFCQKYAAVCLVDDATSGPIHALPEIVFSLPVSHHLVTLGVVSCEKFTSSYCWEMTNATFFMRRIKNSKDPFPSLHSETQGKKTSLNNGWEKGLLRKGSRCGMIALGGVEGIMHRWTLRDRRRLKKMLSCWPAFLLNQDSEREGVSIQVVWPGVVKHFSSTCSLCSGVYTAGCSWCPALSQSRTANAARSVSQCQTFKTHMNTHRNMQSSHHLVATQHIFVTMKQRSVSQGLSQKHGKLVGN